MLYLQGTEFEAADELAPTWSGEFCIPVKKHKLELLKYKIFEY